MRWIPLSALPLAFAIPQPAAAEEPGAEVSRQTRVDARGVRLPRPEAIPDNHVSKILYLNRCQGGCIIEPGQNDARFNTSSIVDGTSSIPEFRHSDDVWNQIVQCVREIYAPYDVEITDEDPGEEIFHHEAIVAGDYTDIGYDPAGGVAPSQCVPANNVISFTFANGFGPDPIRICSVIAQESAHSYGLEHAFDCSDPMTYLSPCGRQFFRDRVTPCGEFEEFDRCFCGGTAQNSHRWLRTVLGENSTPVPGPEVEIAEPSDGADVADGFGIGVFADHMRGIGRVDLLINGTEYGSLEGHEWPEQSQAYWFDAPAELPDGIMDVEIRAYNDIGSESVETITITKGEPCSDAPDCLSGQECDDGRCVWPPPTGQLGDPCESPQQCVSGLCPRADGEAYCSETCTPSSDDACPSGFRCVETDINQGVCWPGSSGGCAAAGGSGGAGALFLGLLAGLYAIPRRRRRACTSSSPTSRQDS